MLEDVDLWTAKTYEATEHCIFPSSALDTAFTFAAAHYSDVQLRTLINQT